MRRLLLATLGVTAVALPLNLVAVQAGVALTTVVLVAGRLRGDWRFTGTVLDGPVVLFVSLALLSLLLTGEKVFSAFASTAVWVCAAYLPLSQAVIVSGAHRRLRPALFALLAASSLVAGYAIFQHFTGVDLFGALKSVEKAQFSQDRFKAVAFFGRHTTLAFGLAFSIVLAAALAVEERGRARLLLLVLAAPLPIALFFTYVRMAWLGVAAGLIVAGMLVSWRWALGASAALAAAAAVAMTLSPSVMVKAHSTFQHEGDMGRSFIWARALEMTRDHAAAGVGLGNYSYVAKRYYDRFDRTFIHRSKAHNLYLQIWCEAGAPALAAFLFIWVRLFRAAWRARRRVTGEEGAALVRAAAGLAACLLAGSIAQDPFFDGQVAFYLLFIAALSAGVLAGARGFDTAAAGTLQGSRGASAPQGA